MSQSQHNDLLNRFWRGRSPFSGFPADLYCSSINELLHGPHPFLLDAISETKARLIVEIGVWKGASSIAMARHLQSLAIAGSAVLSIDTWLGSSEHWIGESSWRDSLNLEFGQPMLFRTFLANVVKTKTEDIILPLPLDSVNAAELLTQSGIGSIDVIHVDAGHDYRSVISDLEMWWPLVRPGGWLIGDDYLKTGEWPGVRRAFDEFFAKQGIASFDHGGNKCRIRKA